MASTKTTEKEYIGRINKVLNYIDKNLNKNLKLNEICEIAYFSPFHFHRIFSAITGETVNVYINRKRIEAIASDLMANEELPLADLAFKYGFSSAATFSRSFKNYYGISPTEFIQKKGTQFSKICKTDSKNSKAIVAFEEYICNINNLKNWLQMNANVEVKQMPELNLAYVKHVGNFHEIGKSYEKLMRWAAPKGLLSSPDLKTVTVYHDNPKVTDISKVRQSASLTLAEDIPVDGEIGKYKLKGGKFAVGRFEIGVMEFEQAWNSMCVWVAEQGYTTSNGDYYELYHNDHTQHPEQKFILDICIPVD